MVEMAFSLLVLEMDHCFVCLMNLSICSYVFVEVEFDAHCFEFKSTNICRDIIALFPWPSGLILHVHV